MLEEYGKRYPQGSLLSDAERRRMTEENRLASQGVQPAPVQTDPDGRPPRQRRTLHKKRSTAEVRRQRTHHSEYEAEAERKTAQDRRRMSEENRREADRCIAALPQYGQEKRHRVPTDEELIAQMRVRQAQEKEQQEAAKLERMRMSAMNRQGLAERTPQAAAWHGAGPMLIGAGGYTAGSSAVAIVPADTDRKPDPDAVRTQQPGLLTDADESPAPEREPRNGAVDGGRFSLARRTHIYPKRMNTVRIILIGAVAVALIGMVIYGKVQTNELYTEISQQQAVYDDIIARNVSMRSEMEGKMTVKNIEEYAENVLGLKQLDQSQIQYIQIQTEDEVTITEPESNWLVTVSDFLTDIWNFLRGA